MRRQTKGKGALSAKIILVKFCSVQQTRAVEMLGSVISALRKILQGCTGCTVSRKMLSCTLQQSSKAKKEYSEETDSAAIIHGIIYIYSRLKR